MVTSRKKGNDTGNEDSAQINLLRKVSLLEFRVASSSDAVKPTPSARIGFGRAGAAGHRRTTRLESSVRNLGGLAIAKAKRGVGRGHSSGEAGNDRGAKGLCVKKEGKGHEDKKYIARKGCQRGQSADDAASRKPLVQVERCRRDQSETILKRFGERER